MRLSRPARILVVSTAAALAGSWTLTAGPLVVEDLTLVGSGMWFLHEGWWTVFTQRDSIYFPLGILWQGAMGWLWGGNPAPARCLTTLLHVANALMVWGFARRWLGERAAIWGAVLFAVTSAKYENILHAWGLHYVAAASWLGLSVFFMTRERAWPSVPAYLLSALLFTPWFPLLPLLAAQLDRAAGRPWRPWLYLGLAAIPAAQAARLFFLWGSDPWPMLVTPPWADPGEWLGRVARSVVSFFAYGLFPFDRLGRPGAVLKAALGGCVALWLIWRGLGRDAGKRVFASAAWLSVGGFWLRELIEARYLYVVTAFLWPLLAAEALEFSARRTPAVRVGVACGAVLLIAGHLILLGRWGGWIRDAAEIERPILADLAEAARPAPPGTSLVAEGLPLWQDKVRLPIPLFTHYLSPIVWALTGRMDLRAFYDREGYRPGSGERVIRLRYEGSRLVRVP